MKIENSEHKLLMLLEAEKLLTLEKDMMRVLKLISDLAKGMLDAERCSIFMYDEGSSMLKTTHADSEQSIEVPCDKGIVGATFMGKEAIIENRPRAHPDFYARIDEETGYTTRNLITEPIFDLDGETIGVFQVLNKRSGDFSETDSQILKYISKHISATIYQAKKEGHIDDAHLRQEINIAILSKNDDFLPAIKQDINALFNLEPLDVDSTQTFEFIITQNRSKSYILLYLINDKKDIVEIEKFLSHTNMPVVVLGPSSSDMALFAGGYQVSSYIGYGEYSSDLLQKVIEENSTNVIKNRKNHSFMASFIGIAGGLGTTTISVNLANLVAKQNPFKNVLYVDLSQTKAISNIFLGKPKPPKKIIDLIKVKNGEMKDYLAEGLVKYRNNFYFVPGIQSHIEREELYCKEGERALLDFLFSMKTHFDYIFIDAGVAEDNDLKLAVEELSDELYLVTELTTVHLSILKTFYDILRKAGWRDKIKIIINRADSKSSISIEDAKQIINDVEKDRVTFDNSLPNESELLRESMNYGELISEKHPECNFTKALIQELINDELAGDVGSKKPYEKKVGLMDKIKKLLK